MLTNTEIASNAVARAREALEQGAWGRARDLFRDAVRGDDTSGEAWEGLAWAAWWLSAAGETITARERAYRRFREAGDGLSAARVAAWLASDHLDFRGDAALAAGWLERSRRLLLDPEPCAEHGWLWLMEAELLLRVGGSPAETERLGRAASDLGRDLEVPDLEAIGMAIEGIMLVRRGLVEDGMRRLDEASAITVAERFESPFSPAWTLCCGVSACEGVGDFRRAGQWSRSMRELADRWGARNMTGVCRSAYGSVLASGGDWETADAELSAAVDDLNATRPGMAALGMVRLAELRARQGRADEAAELFRRSGAHPAAVCGLGRLALASGDACGASDAAERVLRRLDDVQVLDRLPALELLARARVTLGDARGALAPADELALTVELLGTPFLLGRAHLVRAEVELALEQHESARRWAEDAVDALTEGAAPYEAACARVVLAQVLLGLGREDAASREATSARDTFALLGAAADVSRVEALLAPAEAAGDSRPEPGELTARELDVLRLVADGLSDAEVAERLVVSPHTVHRHVANVRTKLRLPSRSAAVAFAARSGLL